MNTEELLKLHDETCDKCKEIMKQKNSDYLCYNCKAICCSFKDLQKHIESCSTKKSTKQSNLAIAKMAKNSCFKKQTAKKLISQEILP